VAVLAPVLETVPQFVPLQPDPVTDQLTDWFALKQTEAVNGCCCPSATVAAEGDMDMAGEQDDVIVMDAEAD
jgi:CO dehydrogenase nickel-insertion accessory protein CooC1